MSIVAQTPTPQPLAEEWRWFAARCRAPRLRTMREFAEQEIVIPDGKHVGLRFRCDRQPYTGLWLDAVDSGNWTRFVATGPTQSGKTLLAFVIPLLYHLFEIRETVVCAVPKMDMAADKWRMDILPVIQRSRYRDQLPRSGGGSRGGKIEAVQFRNGATLRFMSGGGGDQAQAGFTARVLIITETDKMDVAGKASRVADPVSLLEGRTMSFGDDALTYLECTVSIEDGRIWQELKGGTDSRIVLPCPHCGEYVGLEREHLVGWKDADTEIEARTGATFCCTACGVAWSEGQRAKANAGGILLHRGQSLDKRGEVVGDLPATNTLGFRWSAVDNLFVGAARLGAAEWAASRAIDSDNAETNMRQQFWALPAQPPILDTTPLDAGALARRVEQDWTRGRVPDWTDYLTVGVDVHKRHIEWVATAWKADGTGQVVDYGVFDVSADDRRFPIEAAILNALRDVRDMCQRGWTYGEKNRIPDQVWLDHGYQGEVVDLFCLESREGRVERYRPTIGRGMMQRLRMSVYATPRKQTATTRIIGEGYHVTTRPKKVPLVEVNADHWKTWVHRRLSSPADAPASLQLFAADSGTHYDFCRQLTAEKQIEELIPGKGVILRWERIRRSNHYLDCLYNAAAAAHLCGVRLTHSTAPERPAVVTDWFANQKKRPGRRVPVR